MLSHDWRQRTGAVLLLLGAAGTGTLYSWSATVPGAEAKDQSAQQLQPRELQTVQVPDEDSDIDKQVTHDVLEPLQRGLQDFDLQRVMGVFDRDGMPEYGRLREQLGAFFDRYEAIILRYQVLQVTTEKGGAYAVVDVDMDAAPADETLLRQRRSVQMRFHLKATAKGWKVIGFTPSDFFAD